jgi:long-chain acyl-CoA synthetase
MPTDNNDLEINAKIVYNAEYMKQSYPDKNVDDYFAIIWNDIKELNKSMPAYKHIRNIIITDEPMIKTTTQKIKRNEEMKKILGS